MDNESKSIKNHYPKNGEIDEGDCKAHADMKIQGKKC